MVLLVTSIVSGTLVVWGLLSAGGRRLGFAVFSILYFAVAVLGAWNVLHDIGEDTFLKGSLVIFAGSLGMVGGAIWSSRDGVFYRRGLAAQVPATASQLIVVRILVLISIATGVLYYYLSGSVPLLDFLRSLLRGEVTTLNAFRVRIYTIGSERGEVSYFGQGYLRQFFGNILPWAALVLLLEDKFRKRTTRAITLLALAAAVFFALATGQRWPIIYLTLAYVLAFCLYADEGRLIRSLRRFPVIVVGLLAASMLVALTIGQGRADTAGSALRVVLTRIAGTDIRTFFRLLEYVDLYDLWFYGSTWLMDLEAFLPGASPTFSVWVHQVLYGSANTAPPTLLGSFYVNFGLGGVILGFFLASRFAAYLDTILYRRRTVSSLDLATVAYAIMHWSVSIHTDLIPKLYGVIFVFTLNIMVKFAASLVASITSRRSPGKPSTWAKDGSLKRRTKTGVDT